MGGVRWSRLVRVSGASEPCPSCGNPLVAEAPFCHRCGAATGPAPIASVASSSGAANRAEKLTVVLDDPGAGGVPTDPVPRVVVPPGPPPPAGLSGPTSPAAVVGGRAPGVGSRSTFTIVAIAVVVLLVAGVAGAAVLNSGSGGSSGGGASGGPGGDRDPFTSPEGVEPGTDSGGGGEAGGGGGGSTDEYCAVVDEIVAASRESQQQFEEIPEDDPFSGLIFLLGAVGDLQIYVQRLGDAAPPELQPDFEAVTGDMETQLPSNPTDPMAMLGIIASAIVNGAMHQNSYARIDQYTEEHCGVTLFGPSSAAAS